MKKPIEIFLAACLAGLAGTGHAADAGKTSPAKPVPGRSVFLIPTNPREGRDPFFPESTRVVDAVAAANKTVEISNLTIKGFSGPPGHRFVIINNHTFGLGDEGDVLTPTGRVHIRCVEIRSDAVAIEVNGQRHELHGSVQ